MATGVPAIMHVFQARRKKTRIKGAFGALLEGLPDNFCLYLISRPICWRSRKRSLSHAHLVTVRQEEARY